ncbi:MAG: DNA cytosine methyltransferase [Candidatus Micrarchaeia archaeon]
MRKIIAVDFFCGAGGATHGLRKAGIKVLKGLDIDPSAKKTYERNNPGSKFVLADVQTVTEKSVMKGIRRRGKVLLFVGCAPCQPFSLHNRNPKPGDERKSLILSFGRLISKIRPEYIFVENVPRFGKEKNYFFRKFRKMLAYKYVIQYGIMDAKDYGVPQSRKRFVLIGRLKGFGTDITIPLASHGHGLIPYVTVRDAISKYPRITTRSTSKFPPNHITQKLGPKNLQRIKLIRKDGGSRSDLPPELVLECHKTHRGHRDVYGRMAWNLPSPTLTCKCTSITNGRFGHPEQNRAITVREAAAIQTFPDKYIFYGNLKSISRHVGNAVPVSLAHVIGKMFVGACYG